MMVFDRQRSIKRKTNTCPSFSCGAHNALNLTYLIFINDTI